MSYETHQVYNHAMQLVRACNPVEMSALHRELITQTVGVNKRNVGRAADDFISVALANGDIVIDDEGLIDLPDDNRVGHASHCPVPRAIARGENAVCLCATNGNRRITLVYQAGIANVFETTLPSQAKRLLQGSFEQCRMFAMGCGAMGAIVRTAHCNEAGDITDREWSEDIENAPFNTMMVAVTIN